MYCDSQVYYKNCLILFYFLGIFGSDSWCNVNSTEKSLVLHVQTKWQNTVYNWWFCVTAKITCILSVQHFTVSLFI